MTYPQHFRINIFNVSWFFIQFPFYFTLYIMLIALWILDYLQNYRRDAMLRVFSPIGFDLIFTPNTRC
jgi:hypothetical protein